MHDGFRPGHSVQISYSISVMCVTSAWCDISRLTGMTKIVFLCFNDIRKLVTGEIDKRHGQLGLIGSYHTSCSHGNVL